MECEQEGYEPLLSSDPDDVTAAAHIAAAQAAARELLKRVGKIDPPVYVAPIYPTEMRAHDHDEAE